MTTLNEYYNSTVKAVALLRWTTLNCPLVEYLLKLDDDSFLRPHPFLEWLSQVTPNRAIGGSMPEPPVVFRSGKICLSRRFYPAEVFPTFLSCAYLLPGHLTVRLYEAVLENIPAIPFEDVYVTGTLAQAIDLPRMISGHVRYLGQIRPMFDTKEMEDIYLAYDNFDSAFIQVEFQHNWKIWQ